MRHVVLIKSKKPDKFNYCKFSTYKDKRGIIKTLIDPNGIELEGYEMRTAVLSLDISDPDSNRVYEFLKDHPLIHKFDVEDLRANEEKSAETAIRTADAVVVASGLNSKEYRDVARLLGISLDFDDHLLKAKVIQSASNNPENFLEVYNNPDKDYYIFIKKAQDSKHIRFVSGVWKHGSNTLGLTLDQVVIWFKDNPDIHALIKQDHRDGVKGNIKKKKEKVVKESTENNRIGQILKDKE